MSHDSVGTEAELAARAASKKAITSLRLTRAILDPYVLSVQELDAWGYITAIPDVPGGSEPSKEGQIAKCERCSQSYMVKRDPPSDECVYHHGRAYGRKVDGKVQCNSCQHAIII